MVGARRGPQPCPGRAAGLAVSVLGWRQWAVDKDGMLRPAWTPWSPFPQGLLLWRPDGVTRAHCLRGTSHGLPAGPAVPHPECVCGLYAWRAPAALASAPRPRWTRRPIVLGVARFGGRMIIAERGLRASSGYPVAVLDPAAVVSPRYPIARYRHWPALVAEWHADGEPAAA